MLLEMFVAGTGVVRSVEADRGQTPSTNKENMKPAWSVAGTTLAVLRSSSRKS